MLRIKKPREVINRKALFSTLQDTIALGHPPSKKREILKIFKTALNEGRAELRRRFEKESLPGPQLVRAQSYLMDQIIRTIYDFTLAHVYPEDNLKKDKQPAIVAIGGYGRGELAPYSDVDLLFLVPCKQTLQIERIIEYMLYMLWDMDITVGHAIRSIYECIHLANEDMTIRTSLLDARDLWGNQDLFETFRKRFYNDIVQSSRCAFVEAKMTERDTRHSHMGDTRCMVEPNIKEGKGGLRDMQTLFWIVKYLYDADDPKKMVKLDVLTKDDARRFRKAHRFLWTTRCHLHYLANRAEEWLTFDAQRKISVAMGYAERRGSCNVERFMKHFHLTAKEVGHLTRVICAVLEEDHAKHKPLFSLSPDLIKKPAARGFKLDHNRLIMEQEDLFEHDPISLLRLFHTAQAYECDIHPKALRQVIQNLKCIDKSVRENTEANQLFLEMLTSKKNPELTLRRMNEVGLLGRFMPIFGRIVAQMQYDMYHFYTVDEHTMRAIGILADIEAGKLKVEHLTSSEVIHKLLSRRALYVAVLLHDIAKGRKGDHSVLGADIARKICPRLGLSDEETETVSWLVLHHLAMSRVAFKRDVYDSKIIMRFVELVQSPERLRMLLVLTAADIHAVGPNVWNAWKATLLRDLYFNTLEAMIGDPAHDRHEQKIKRVKRAKEDLRKRLSDWPQDEVDAFIARGYSDYWLSVNLDTKVEHATLIRSVNKTDNILKVIARVVPERDVTEIIVYVADHPGLFAHIAGALALSGAAIVDARAFTMVDGMALDTFSIQNSKGGPFTHSLELKCIKKCIVESLEGCIHLEKEIKQMYEKIRKHRTHVFKTPARVLVDNQASSNYTIVEINGRDRPGFLFDVANAFVDLYLQIGRAHIATYGERVVDVFYVKDLFGLKVYEKNKIRRIRERLITVIEPK